MPKKWIQLSCAGTWRWATALLDWEAEMFPREYHLRFTVRPGLTGLWQVSGRSTMGTLEIFELDASGSCGAWSWL